VDEFMAKTLAVRLHPAVAEEAAEEAHAEVYVSSTDASLTSNAAYLDDDESSARLITAPEPALPKAQPIRPHAEVVALPARVQAEESARAPEEAARLASHNRRAEAWDRERERTQRSADRRPGAIGRRRSGA
jgi:hypothetical protein